MTTGGHDTDDERTVVVDSEVDDAVKWVERELREARKALWDGQCGRAFASVEAAQDEFETIETALSDGGGDE